jgi:hypothetical protein
MHSVRPASSASAGHQSVRIHTRFSTRSGCIDVYVLHVQFTSQLLITQPGTAFISVFSGQFTDASVPEQGSEGIFRLPILPSSKESREGLLSLATSMNAYVSRQVCGSGARPGMDNTTTDVYPRFRRAACNLLGYGKTIL